MTNDQFFLFPILSYGNKNTVGAVAFLFFSDPPLTPHATQGVVNLFTILALANLLMSAMIMLSTTQYAEYLEYREQERESGPSTKHSSYKSLRRQHTFIYISQV